MFLVLTVPAHVNPYVGSDFYQVSVWKVPLRRLSVLIPNVTNFADACLNPGP